MFVKVNQLHPVGSELFNDSESYLNELTENEVREVQGGYKYSAVTSDIYINSQITISQGISLATLSAVSNAPLVVNAFNN
ncbi:hypothetical protein NIES4071_53520 [Calothrix sp. NIES-4071]|nr:hypothetical protein NIES4071_53520 [Calothrix sp. NIES-4071]BAZ59660.1 hypothetical protein NIES4105_53470 [Calothrix sp. NIES-4105]